MTSVGIRTLKNQLSRYVRRAAAGESVLVTDRGRVVAALVPPSSSPERGKASRYNQLLSAGAVRPSLDRGDPLAGFPALRLRKGTAAQLVNEDRGGT